MKQKANKFAAMENLRVQTLDGNRNKKRSSQTKCFIRLLRVMKSQEKPTKLNIVYVEAIKIERANVKIHINYSYNSNLYALFTCFVFAISTTSVDMDTHFAQIKSPFTRPHRAYILSNDLFMLLIISDSPNSFSLQLSPCAFFLSPLFVCLLVFSSSVVSILKWLKSW